MTENTNKPYDLEERTLAFSKSVIQLCKKLPKDTIAIEFIKQIVRSATSVGANYIEANEAFSKKDFVHRMSIARKEAKETTYWLKLIEDNCPTLGPEINLLLQEIRELRNIFTAIMNKCS